MGERSMSPYKFGETSDKTSSELKRILEDLREEMRGELKKSLQEMRKEIEETIILETKALIGQAIIHGLNSLLYDLYELFSYSEVIAYKGKPVATLSWLGDHIEFKPEIPVKATHQAITNFLKKDVLEKIREKHGFDYVINVEEEGSRKDDIRSIEIYGQIRERHVKDLKDAVAWAFAAAGGLISEEPRKDILERAEKMFPNELIDKISLELSGGHIIVKPKQFLGSKLFSELADIARNKLGGEYISAGKDSHFRIPLEAMKQ